MRWIWRIFILFLIITLMKMVWFPQPQAFISWPEKNSFVERLKLDWHRWQKEAQELPDSLEVEIRRLWQNYQPDGSGTSV